MTLTLADGDRIVFRVHANGTAPAANAARFNAEPIAASGEPGDIGGYDLPDPGKTLAPMRLGATPSVAL